MTRCTICRSNKLGSVDKALIAGGSVREVGVKYGFSKDAIARHQRKCIASPIAKIIDQRGIKLLEHLQDEIDLIHQASREILARSQTGRNIIEKGDVKTIVDDAMALKAIRECRENITLVARMSGQLEPKDANQEKTITWEQFQVVFQQQQRNHKE